MPYDDFPSRRVTPPHIHHLKDNEIFVFGSNTSGRHLGGASWMAYQRFGAVMGQAEGLQGQSYAIPTVLDRSAWVASEYPLEQGMAIWRAKGLPDAVDRFIAYAAKHPELQFLVTRVGCGNGGYRDRDIAPLFARTWDMENVSLPHTFVNVLRRMKSAELRHAMEERLPGKGLDFMFKTKYYALSDAEEARSLLAHPVYGNRLREVAIGLLEGAAPAHLLPAGGMLNFNVYLKSCMTLLDYVSPHDVFGQVLNERFGGERCEKTLRRLRMEEGTTDSGGGDPCPKPSHLTITSDHRILLSDYTPVKEVVMEPIVKALYLLYLKHPDGIAFSFLCDHKDELADIYRKLKGKALNTRAMSSIEKLCDSTNNSINEKCSRAKAAFIKVLGEQGATPYLISGEAGEAKRIALYRDLVTWEENVEG